VSRALLRIANEWMARFFAWLYERGAWAYPVVAGLVSWGRWPAWVEAAARQVPRRARVLELGFGPGYAQAVWAARGQRAWGVDLSLPMARRAARRVRARRGVPRVVQARAQALPWPSASVDWVFSTFPAPYIADPATAREIARVLRPGGQVGVLLTVSGGPLAWWERALRWAARRAGAEPSPETVLQRVYATVGLHGTWSRLPLPGGAHGAWFRAAKRL